jgi:hypothetical protein
MIRNLFLTEKIFVADLLEIAKKALVKQIALSSKGFINNENLMATQIIFNRKMIAYKVMKVII